MIKNLLPLYMENICSTESWNIIEDHLSNCQKCKDYQETIAKEISVPTIDETKVQEFLLEKDLLLKGKKSIQQDFVGKLIFVVNLISIVLTIVFVIAGVVCMLCEYPAKYPVLHTDTISGSAYALAFAIDLFPLLFGFMGIIHFRKKILLPMKTFIEVFFLVKYQDKQMMLHIYIPSFCERHQCVMKPDWFSHYLIYYSSSFCYSYFIRLTHYRTR